MNLCWLLLGPHLELSEASNCCLFERIWEVVKHEPRPTIHMEKQLEWASKLGRPESLGISKVGQTVLAKLMESQVPHQFAVSVGGRFRKGTMACAHLPDTSVSPSMSFMPFNLLPWCWSSEGVSLSS